MSADSDRTRAATEGSSSPEEQLRRVIDTAPIVLWSVDVNGTFTTSEGRGLVGLGLSPGQVVGLSVYDVYKDNPVICDHVREVLSGQERSWSAEVDGLHFETQCFPLRAAGGKVTGALGVSLDVSERARARFENDRLQTQLLQVQKLESLGVLAGGIAHDFNNWLTAILGSTSAVLVQLSPESPWRYQLENVVSAATRAGNLTRQLLAYAGKGTFEIKTIDLSAHVRELAAVIETTIPKLVQLRLELAGEVPPIDADIGQIQQLIMNLVINGAEAIGDQRGTVLITTGVQDIDEVYALSLFSDALTPGRYVYLEVHDTGCGMDEATRIKIFDPFFTTKFQGRGLGLAAVLGIVRAHRGAIKVYSSPGRGTTFKTFFPATQGHAIRPSPRPPPFHGEGLILIVDDDQGVRSAARALLELFGFSVIEASDGRSGVNKFAEHAGKCVCVLLDMTMPEMGGEEAFRELRTLDRDVPVILMSGYNEIEATRRFTSKGLAGFLQKPFTPDELGQKLRVALRQ